jgi:undecaprenyl diphosphate synthase
MSDSKSKSIPKHIAIIMDGNGRWAKQRFQPRFMGHRAGVKAVESIVQYCAERGVEVLSLFAFSSENWRRPSKEVTLFMELFSYVLNY